MNKARPYPVGTLLYIPKGNSEFACFGMTIGEYDCGWYPCYWFITSWGEAGYRGSHDHRFISNAAWAAEEYLKEFPANEKNKG